MMEVYQSQFGQFDEHTDEKMLVGSTIIMRPPSFESASSNSSSSASSISGTVSLNSTPDPSPSPTNNKGCFSFSESDQNSNNYVKAKKGKYLEANHS